MIPKFPPNQTSAVESGIAPVIQLSLGRRWCA
jgi:hypothetical protein